LKVLKARADKTRADTRLLKLVTDAWTLSFAAVVEHASIGDFGGSMLLGSHTLLACV